MEKPLRILGVMTGSSLDGIDAACVDWHKKEGAWTFDIVSTGFLALPDIWRKRLEDLPRQNIHTYLKTHAHLGRFFGKAMRSFIESKSINPLPDAIALHGQTIFHQPQDGFTAQIGDPNAVALITGLPVIADFRGMDVAAGGEGTPLAPVLDRLVFSQHPLLMNLGGISNITYNGRERSIAFDITGVNLLLNALARKEGKEYDEGGAIARKGQLIPELFDQLNDTHYYQKPYPKSLSQGWVWSVLWPLIATTEASVEDLMHTVVKHIAHQTTVAIKQIEHQERHRFDVSDVLWVTGGGALNDFLVEEMRKELKVQVVVPETRWILFKEAILMSLLGALRLCGEVNSFASVTGARFDTVGGAVYSAPKGRPS